MIVWPAEYNARKAAVFAALAQADGGGRRLPFVPLSLTDWPETAGRVATAVARAKKAPNGPVGRWAKATLIRGQYNWARDYFTRHPDHLAVAWNGLTGSRMAYLAGARDAGAAVLHAELAPFPGRVTLDPAGVNAEGSVPQDPDVYRPYTGGDDWRRLGDGLAARPSRRADVGQVTGGLPDAPFLFCPLQVPDDTQVQLFAGWTGGMAGFLQALADASSHLPGGWHLRVKEHPSARMPLDLSGLGPRIVVDNATDSFAQLAAARGVVTLNSSMGLQAFLWDKPVMALGRAFWALPGLALAPSDQTALNAAFAAPDWTFDAPLRGGFMTWLDRHYYPRFAWPGGDGDTAAFAARIAEARALR
jgi:capsular polysaccharide export protein